MLLHNIMMVGALLVFCQVASADFDVGQDMFDQHLLDNTNVARLHTGGHFATTERLLATTGSILQLSAAQQRTDTSPNAELLPANTLRITRVLEHQDPEGTSATDTGVVVQFSHDHLQLQHGHELALELAGFQHDEVEAYVRNPSIAAMQDNTLAAKDVGSSEVIFIIAKTLHILPLTVIAGSAIPHANEEAQDVPYAEQQQITNPASVAPQFSLEAQSSLYGEIEIQVVDERSYDSYVYPVDELEVRIVGAQDMELRSDAQGKVRIMGLPLQGRILVEFSDPLGRYISGFQELTLDPNTRSYRFVALRSITDDSMATISGRVRHAQLASMCGELEQGEALQIETDVPADGVFYFNKLGLLDRQQRDTSRFPRFCILNADPGPMTIFVKDAQGEQVGVFNVSLAAGHHSEAKFRLWADAELQLRLSTQGIASHKRQLVDSAQVRMLGGDGELPVSGGIIQAYPSYHQQRSHLLVEDPDFEQTLHALEQNGNSSMLTLLPRGTLAHIALQANVSYDASMGSVYAEIGYEDAIDVRLISADGKEVLPIWSQPSGDLAAHSNMVAAFLNLPFGVYQLLVKNSSGHWLAVQTVMVYDESVSQLWVGNELRYRAAD